MRHSTAYGLVALQSRADCVAPSIAPYGRDAVADAGVTLSLKDIIRPGQNLERKPFGIIAVVGPTGAGKSDLGAALARRFDGEIVSCDSVQVYRGLDIGTAKAPPAERAGIPHHLLDVISPCEELTAGDYSRLARAAISGIHEAGRVPIVVGGTGFYLRALLDGLSPAPGRDPLLRARLARLAQDRPQALFRYVRRYDPPAAKRIHPNDIQKLTRAVELTIRSGKPASEIQSAPRQEFRGARTLKLGILPNRAELHACLNARAAWMFSHGLLEETRLLLAAGYSPSLKPLQSVGYKQAVKVVMGEMPLQDAIAECQAKTRQYAKRQLTWFRADPEIRWLAGFGGDADVQRAAAQAVAHFLTDLSERP